MTIPKVDGISDFQRSVAQFACDVNLPILVLNSDINVDSLREVIEALEEFGHQREIWVVLNSLGGEIEYAFWIAKYIRGRCDEMNVLVHDRAKSAATLIALTASRIYLGQIGELGPLDPQVRNPAGGSSLRSPLESVKGVEFLRAHYLEAFDMVVNYLRRSAGMDIAHAVEYATRASAALAESLYRPVNHRDLGEAVQRLAVGEKYAREAMRRWSPLSEDATDSVVEHLVWEYPDHGHIIDVEECLRIGLTNVSYLDLRLESLLYDLVRIEEPFVVAALPEAGNFDDLETLGQCRLIEGEEFEDESGEFCEEQA